MAEKILNTGKNTPTMKLLKGAGIKKNAPAEQDLVEVEDAQLAGIPDLDEEDDDEEGEDLTPKAVVKTATVKMKVKAQEKPEVTAEQDLSSDEDLIVQVAHQVENMKEDKAFKLVPQLLDSIDKDYFILGGILSAIQNQGWYMDKGYENFRAYVENECSIQYRKAMYLISIYNGLVESGVAWAKVSELGWTKLKELAGILTPDNVDEWVGYAKEMTTLQLQEFIKSKTAGAVAGGDAPVQADVVEAAKKTVTTMTFKVHPDQKDTVKAALEKAKHETGTTVDTVALEHICLDFLSGTKLKNVPTLKELMDGRSAEEVLEVFGEVFPDVVLEATLPE